MATTPLFDASKSGEVGDKIDEGRAGTESPAPIQPPSRGQELLRWILREVAAQNDARTTFVNNAREAYRFVAGDQYDAETRRVLRMNKRPDTAFNSVQKFVRYVSGIERRAPRALRFEPAIIDNLQQQSFGEYLTQGYEWAMSRCGGSYERSRAFEDLLITGIGCTETYLDKQRDPRGLIQHVRVSPMECIWPECLAGDTQVRTPPIRRGFRRLFSGRMVQIYLENGKSLTGTLNHPVLTNRGWKPLGMLNPGDHLVDGSLIDLVKVDPGYFDQVETALEKKINSLTGAVRRVATCHPDQFHSDGSGSKVYDEWNNVDLWSEGVWSKTRQQIIETLFAFYKFAYWNKAATFQSVYNRRLVHPEALRDRASRYTGIVERQEFLQRNLLEPLASVLANRTASELEAIVNNIDADPQFLSDASSRQLLDEIKSPNFLENGRWGTYEPSCIGIKAVRHFVCHDFPVWNLSTDCGFYVAEGVITSNCSDENLRTTRWRAREAEVDKADAIRQFPKYAALIEALGAAREQRSFPSGPSQIWYTVDYIETEPIDKSRKEPSLRNKVKLMQFQYVSDEEGRSFHDPVTGEYVWMDEEEFRRYERELQILSPNVRVLAERVNHRVYRSAYILDRRYMLGDPKRLPGDRFTLNFMTGHYDEDSRQWYGFVRLLMDPQRYANKFFNQLIEIIAVSAKGGAIVETTAFDDNAQRDAFKQTYSQPGSVNEVSHGALAEGRFREKQAPTIPPATMTMLEWCIRSMEQVTGLSMTSLGLESASGGEMPAQMMRQRQHISQVLLAHEFDSLSRYRTEDEARTIAAFLGLIADGRLIRVAGDYGPETIKLLREPFSLEYDVIIDDTDQDPMLRQQYSQFLMQVAPHLSRMGMFVPSMLNYLPFPVKVRQEIIQGMMEERKRNEMAAQMGINLHGRGAPKDPRETQAKIDKLKAQTQLEMARTAEIVSGARREDLRASTEASQAQQRAVLEATRQDMERSKAQAQLVTDLMEIITKHQEQVAKQNSGRNDG